MTFALHVDQEKFDTHLHHVIDEYQASGAQIVPVIKGNGYGFGRTLLASQVAKLGLDKLAVGTVWELRQALDDFAGTVLVLQPFDPRDELAIDEWREALRHAADRILVTVSNPDISELTNIGVQHIYLEGITSMRRFGLERNEIIELLANTDVRALVRGLSIHLPIAEPTVTHFALLEETAHFNERNASGWVLEAASWCTTYMSVAQEFDLPLHVCVSHLSASDVKVLCANVPGMHVDVRVGTRLWLGAPQALRVTGKVLEIHDMAKGNSTFGYSQSDSRGHKRLVIVSGGTAHGVALAATTTMSSIRKRGVAVAEGLGQALGKVRSPFMYKKKNLLFAEPPHMHASLLWTEDTSLNVGDELECTVRNTTTIFDVVTGL